MKKAGKIILILVILFIHPEKVIYEPKIVAQNGNPIENGIVARIEESESKIRNLIIMNLRNLNRKL